jgi:hypothetical protein
MGGEGRDTGGGDGGLARVRGRRGPRHGLTFAEASEAWTSTMASGKSLSLALFSREGQGPETQSYYLRSPSKGARRLLH